MMLIFIDESGVSFERNGSMFQDGPYALWAGLMVPENKYFHLERTFYDLMRRVLKLKDWGSVELHATDIWHGKGGFSDLSLKHRQLYFDELFQLLAKLEINVVVGIQQKNPKAKSKASKSKRETFMRAQYSMLHGLEYRLSHLNETGVLIADDGDHTKHLSKLVFDRTKWRYNPGKIKAGRSINSKYYFESQSCFLLDQLHTVDSKESFFIQLTDQVTFVLQRVFTYLYLKRYPKANITADIAKVPVTLATYNFFCQRTNPLIATYKTEVRDVTLEELSRVEFSPFQYAGNHLIDFFSPYR